MALEAKSKKLPHPSLHFPPLPLKPILIVCLSGEPKSVSAQSCPMLPAALRKRCNYSSHFLDEETKFQPGECIEYCIISLNIANGVVLTCNHHAHIHYV